MANKIVFILTLVILLITLNVSCFASSDDELFEQFISGVPDDILKITGFESFNSVSEKLEFDTVIKATVNLISEQFSACWTLLTTLLIIVMLLSFMDKLEFNSSLSLKRITSSISSITIISISLVYVQTNIETVKESVDTMKVFTAAAVPVVISCCISSGEAFSATLFSTSMSFANAVFDLLTENYLISLVIAFISFGAIGSINNRFNAGNVNGYLKRFIKWIIGLYIGLFSSLISFRRFAGSASDNVAKRGIKLAVGSLIPFVGSSISSSIDGVFTMGQAAKTSVCIAGIIIIVVIFAPVIAGCVCYGLVFSITKIAAAYLNVKNIDVCLSSIGDAFYIIAGLLCTCVYSVIISFMVICINL